MPRLPIPGQDNNTWGDILNEYLLVSHGADGTIKSSAVTSSHIRDNAVTFGKLSQSLQNDIQTHIDTAGGSGAGQDGADGREIELNATATHLQWRYAATGSTPATAWTNLVALADIRGPQGVQGDDGAKGDKGDKGDDGEQGLQGVPGVAGAAGPKGDKGDKGDPGEKGDPGAAGAPGMKGDKGDQGEKGDPGAQGQQGEKGDKGDKGDPGEQGPQGSAGIQGEKGDRGDKGDPGDIGPAGEKGDQGEQGIQGIQGLPGTPGDKGDRGDQGEKGDKGDPGQGIPTGGASGQILSKRTNDDYDTEWIAAPSAGQTYAYATTDTDGVVRRATVAEATDGTDTAKYVTPEGVKAAVTAAVASTPTAGPVLFVNTLSDLPPGTPVDTLVVVRAA